MGQDDLTLEAEIVQHFATVAATKEKADTLSIIFLEVNKYFI